MSSVNFPTSVGGDGSTVTDDSNASTGLANGGHRTRFVPALAQLVAVAAFVVNKANQFFSSNGITGTSSTSLAIGTGSTSLTIEAGKSFVAGQGVKICDTAAPDNNWMKGTITNYTSGSGALVVNVTAVGGSGIKTSWTVFVISTIDLLTSTFMQGLLDDPDASTAQTTLGISAYIKTLIDDADQSTARATLGLSEAYLFAKADPLSVAFIKTGANTVSVKAGTYARVGATLVSWAADTAIVMPALTAGTDYAIYACTDGSIRADANQSAPIGYTTANSRKVGGFHYGLVAAGTTVAGGSFATTGNGMIWTQSDVDTIAGINAFSLWDLKFRPACSDPRGMALVGGRVWVDIYPCSTDTAANGTSKYNSNIASGSVLPKIPAAFGGNGTTTYPSLNWWVANELARANQKRLPWEHEFVEAAFGVTENQSIDAIASTYPNTQRNAGYTSKYGVEQASGHQWMWGMDSNFYSEVASPAGSWKQVTGNTGAAGSERGQIYTFGTAGLVRVLLGGARTNGSISGSRASNWGYYPWNSGWHIGLRAVCDHLQPV